VDAAGRELHGSRRTTTALVGETGSGKTTLGYLTARLYDVVRGSVAIDGVDVRDLSFQALAELVGVVSQETYLFHASIRENLRFAKPTRPTRRSRSPPRRRGSIT
jgi:ABC-type bacteriocin/lantibiotic exporters, contain an N-terminal double-glycine peptidase domain